LVLLVSLDFRMTSTPLHSDLVLPAATWCEKTDLSSTDMHPFVHQFNPAINHLWESRSDWDIYKTIAKDFSELSKQHMPEPVKEVVTMPLMHDSPGELATRLREAKDWSKGEVDAVPGLTMPNFNVVERDYTQIFDKYVTVGPKLGTGKIGAHGVQFSAKKEFEELKSITGVYTDGSIRDGLP